jgi:hypothetical protein
LIPIKLNLWITTKLKQQFLVVAKQKENGQQFMIKR